MEATTKEFAVKCPHRVTSRDEDACEPQIIDGFAWKIRTRKFPSGSNHTANNPTSTYLLKVYLECSPVDNKQADWECTVQCQVTFSRIDIKFNPIYSYCLTQPRCSLQMLPYKLLTFSRTNNCQYVDDFYREEEKGGYCDLNQCPKTYWTTCVNVFTVSSKLLSVKRK
uniref:Uncharacterized protein n=1 Tax=Cacopsylla melanoneura TaxID=428564 RepID=A0A8D8X4I9_9HEMI